MKYHFNTGVWYYYSKISRYQNHSIDSFPIIRTPMRYIYGTPSSEGDKRQSSVGSLLAEHQFWRRIFFETFPWFYPVKVCEFEKKYFAIKFESHNYVVDSERLSTVDNLWYWRILRSVLDSYTRNDMKNKYQVPTLFVSIHRLTWESSTKNTYATVP